MGEGEIRKIYDTYSDAWKLFREILLNYKNTDAYVQEVIEKMKEFEAGHPDEKLFAHQLMSVFYARIAWRTKE